MKTCLTNISVHTNKRFQQLNCGNLTYSSSLSCRHACPLQILLIWPSLYCCAFPTNFFPQLVLMALLPGSCPGGTGSAGCYLSLVGWLCLSPRHSHTCHFSPSSDLWAFLHAVNLQVQLTHCAHMANANTCVWLDMDTQKHARTYKSKGFIIRICACVNAHMQFVSSGGLTKLFLSLSFGIHYSPGLLSESLYSLREVPICGSMWQGGSKSPLMNQYVGGLSLWRGRPRTAMRQPGKNICICSHQTLLMSADI